jgi:hypothetical protein
LVERYENARRYPEAAVCAQQLIHAEPLLKNGYMHAMRLYALIGDPPSALNTYTQYEKLIRQELGAQPEEDIAELYRQIKKNKALQYQASKDLIPLVGRNAEWKTAQDWWKGSLRGSPHVLIIQGEAGIGKTRLAEELVGWAARQGIRTAAAHGYSTEGFLPYAPVITWLRTLGVPGLDKVWMTELARLLPELLPKKNTHLEPLTEAWQRNRLFEALRRAVLDRMQPTLLLLDDLQWVDADTLEWLHYLLRFADAPLMVVGTVRAEEADANPACARLLTALKLGENHLEIEIGPLSKQETLQLAGVVAGKDLDQGIGDLLYEETEGSPLFIVETVRSELYKKLPLPGVQPLPYKARAVLENRVRQLSPPALETARLAATFGRAFTFDTLRAAESLGEADLLKGLDELLGKRVIHERRPGAFLFSHDKLRDAVVAEISSLHQQVLHRRAAETLMRITQNSQENRFGEIARHFELAGQAESAFRYSLLAAESARALFANEQAVFHYQRALELCLAQEVVACSCVSPEGKVLLYENLGEVLALTGDYPQALERFEKALELPYESSRLWRSRVYRKISEALIPQYQHIAAQEALRQAECALAQREGEDNQEERQEWLQVQLMRSQLLYWGNRPDEMDEILIKIQPVLEKDGRPDQRCEMLSQQYMARLRHERYRVSAETVELAQRRFELTRSQGNPYDTAWALFLVGFGQLWHGDHAAARDNLRAAHEAAVRLGTVLLQTRCLAYLSIVDRYLGAAEELRTELPRLIALAISINEYAYIGIGRANQGWLAWRDGDLAEARRLCLEAQTAWQKSGGDMFHCLADWVLLAIAVVEKDLPQAESAARALLAPDTLTQPVLPEAGHKLKQALDACGGLDESNVFPFFGAALAAARASREL